MITRKDLTHLEWVVQKDEAIASDEPEESTGEAVAADPSPRK